MTGLAFYVGLSGLQMEVDSFELGQGISIRKTYAHLMTPYVVAFKRPEQGKPHPAPWVTTSQGKGYDVEAELLIPKGLPKYENWRVAVAILFLLRIGINPAVTAPIGAAKSFGDIEAAKDGSLAPHALEQRDRVFALRVDDGVLSESGARWLRDHWVQTCELLESSPEFALAVAAIDEGQFEKNTALTLVSLWGALEALFSGERSELRFRVSSYIAAYLHESGSKRRERQKKVGKLYDKRSAAAHGVPKHNSEDVFETISLMREVLMKIIEEGKVPSRTRLEEMLFG